MWLSKPSCKTFAMPVVLTPERWFNLYWMVLIVAGFATAALFMTALPVSLKVLFMSFPMYVFIDVYQKLKAQSQSVIELKSFTQWQSRAYVEENASAPQSLSVRSYWQFPQSVLLHLKSDDQAFFILLRRSIIGAEHFSCVITALKHHQYETQH